MKNTSALNLTRGELVTLANCINESLEAVEDWEFSTRVGASKDEAKALHAKIAKALAEQK